MIFGVGCLAAFVIGWMLAAVGGYRIQEEVIGSMAPFILMVVGSIGVVFALLLALGTYALAPGKKGASPASHWTTQLSDFYPKDSRGRRTAVALEGAVGSASRDPI